MRKRAENVAVDDEVLVGGGRWYKVVNVDRREKRHVRIDFMELCSLHIRKRAKVTVSGY